MDHLKKMSIDTKKIEQIIQSHIELANNLSRHVNHIENICSLAIKTLKNNKKIIFCGNGGSAADSMHLAAELVGRFEKNKRKGLKAISLSSNTANITSIGNDYGFEHIFSRQLEALGNNGDLLIAFSTSGKSKNIINALKKAVELKIECIGITGNDGGHMSLENCKELLVINSNSTARIQEIHLLFGHILCNIIEQEFN